MGERSEHEVETVFSGKDSPLQAAIGRIVEAGHRVNHVFDHASEMLGGLASVASVVGGAFSLERAVESTKEYMNSIDRITRLTGMSTASADGLLEAMENVNIEGDTAERILLGMSRKTETMEMHMNALGQSTGSTASLLRGMGVNLKKGPVSAFEDMAKAVQRGKLGVSELGIAFGVPRRETIALYEMLQKGPKFIRENVAEAKRFGVTIGDLQAYKRMQDAQGQISAAWKRISIIVGSELMPFIADLLKGGAQQMRGWVEHAREFGQTLGRWLRDHYQTVIKIGKVLLANYALQKATGSGIGGHLFGFGERGAKGEGGKGSAAVGLIGKAFKFTTGGIIGGGTSTALRVIQGVLSVVGRLSIIASVAMIAWSAFSAIRDNVLGVREYFSELWDRIALRFAGIKMALQPLFKLFSTDGTIGQFFTKTLVTVIKSLGKAVEFMLENLHVSINFWQLVHERGFMAMLKNPTGMMESAWIRTMAQQKAAKVIDDQRKAREAAAKRDVPKERERQPYFDFRGSRFDIKQSFADVDPDRIAVAFANGLGALGERRVQSSFSPIWAV